jgi:hypothetical protein
MVKNEENQKCWQSSIHSYLVLTEGGLHEHIIGVEAAIGAHKHFDKKKGNNLNDYLR